MPGSLPPLDTTPLGTSPERSLTVGDHGKPLPQRPYIGAGYDPDGNVDPVFLAYAYGKELAGGRNRFDRKAVQKGVARWIRHCHGQAAAGEGPAATRALYDHMAAKGKAASLLSDSLLIASGRGMARRRPLNKRISRWPTSSRSSMAGTSGASASASRRSPMQQSSFESVTTSPCRACPRRQLPRERPRSWSFGSRAVEWR